MSEKKQKINLYENDNQLLNSSIDKITVEIINKKNQDEDSQVIVMTGCSPLAGSTSTSISLSIAIAATGRKTLLVDCDVRKNTEYKKLNDKIELGLADYITCETLEGSYFDRITYETNVNNLHYVPCGNTKENTTRILCSERIDSFLKAARDRFDYIIMDFPSYSVVPDAQIMFSKADGIILIAALGETKRVQIKDARRLMKVFNDKYYGMIINKTPKDIFRANVKNADYYLMNKFGKQQFENSRAYKKRNVSKED